MHTAVFLAGFTGIFGKLIHLSEGPIVWYRMLISAITLWLYLYATQSYRILPFKEIWHIGKVGFMVALHWLLFYASIKYANVSIGVICFSSVSLFTALLEPLLLKKKWDLTELLFSLITILGIYLIFHFDVRFRTGILIGLLSSAFAALFTIYNKQLLVKFDTETVTLYEMMTGWICLSLLLPFYFHFFPQTHFLPSWQDAIYLLLLAWVCTVGGFMLGLRSLKKISPFTVNLSYNLEPVYSITLAFLLFHENKEMDASFYLGVTLIVVSVMLQMMRILYQRKRNQQPSLIASGS